MLVFALVTLTMWRPAFFAVPALVVIAGLGALDQAIVTTRARSRSQASADSPAFGSGDRLDGEAVTMALPRVRPVDPHHRPPRRKWESPVADDVLSWSSPQILRPDDPDAAHTMAIDMRAFLDDGPVWVR